MFGNSRFVGRDNVLYDKSIGVRPAIENKCGILES